MSPSLVGGSGLLFHQFSFSLFGKVDGIMHCSDNVHCELIPN